MSIKSRVAKLEKNRLSALPLVQWDNFYVSKPEDIIPDRSGLDWMELRFGPPVEVTDVVDEYVKQLPQLTANQNHD